MLKPRRKAKVVTIGNVRIGGNNPIAIQSMVKTKTSDIISALKQIKALQACGCDIVRLAVKDSADARAIKEIKKSTSVALVADIHFDYRLALQAIDAGVDKIRLNPGNIFRDSQIKEVVVALKQARKPLRIGVNSGSVPSSLGKSMKERLVAACLNYMRKIERWGFDNIVLSLKGSTVEDTIFAYRKIAKACGYPLHLGLTASGLPRLGIIKSSCVFGVLLSEGIGDTIRVSLTAPPEEEVRVAQGILSCLGLGNFSPEIISCPTCGRCEVDLITVVRQLEEKIAKFTIRAAGKLPPLRIAVMGCIVNGPGEARDADIGVAFGKKEGLLFARGRPLKKISRQECVGAILEKIEEYFLNPKEKLGG